MAESRYEIGVDVGGTFTDCVLADRIAGRVWSAKVLTTHDLPSWAIFEGFEDLLRQAGIEGAEIGRFVHTTTLVGNAVIEHQGNKTALVATKGFRDVLHLRREYRYDLFEPLLEFPEPLVPRALSFEVDERMNAQGQSLKAPTPEAIARLATQLRAAGVESVAVSLVHAYANSSHEEAIGRELRSALPDVTVSLSTHVLPQIREYERTSATVINAYVQPLVSRYLDDLERGLHKRGCNAQVLIVTSSGGTVGVDTAKAMPIQLVESGPAAGVVFAARLGEANDYHDLVAFDMGGTTAKVCIIRNGRPQVRTDLEVARAKRFKQGSGLPVGIPLFDLLEIGAGGGSIAQVDPTGFVSVGPRSSGSMPGPACYGRGGTQPTVTDANLVIGFLDPDAFLGGTRKLDAEAARRAVQEHLAHKLNVSVEAAAEAVYRIVTESMAEALRMRSVESNVDVRRYTLMAFGGGGSIHAVEIARRVGISKVVCPPRAGVFCAAGLLVSPVSIEVMRTQIVPLANVPPGLAGRLFVELEREARAAVAAVGSMDYEFEYAVDMSYIGQEYELTVAYPGRPGDTVDAAELARRFEEAYRARYGRILERFEKRIVTWRLKLVGPQPATLQLARAASTKPTRERRVYMSGRWVDAAIYDRSAIAAGTEILGPAIVQDIDTTIVLPPSTRAICDSTGALLIDTRWEAGRG